MSSDSDDDWGDDLGGDDSMALVSKIGMIHSDIFRRFLRYDLDNRKRKLIFFHKQDEMKKSNALDLATQATDRVSPVKAQPSQDRISDPLLRQFSSVDSSISSSLAVVEELTEKLANCYMDTLMKKTILEKQSIVLQSIVMKDRLEQQKIKAQQKASILAKLRLEYDQLLQTRISQNARQHPNEGFQISYKSVNYYLFVSFIALPLLAVYLAMSMILSNKL